MNHNQHTAVTTEKMTIKDLKDYEKLDKTLSHSPKRGITFVKVYKPFLPIGVFLHPNGRTKYVHFHCRFYSGTKLPKTFKVFKSHVLELPITTIFQEYKEACLKNRIEESTAEAYVIIRVKNHFSSQVKIVDKEDFHIFLDAGLYKKKYFYDIFDGKSEERIKEMYHQDMIKSQERRYTS